MEILKVASNFDSSSVASVLAGVVKVHGNAEV